MTYRSSTVPGGVAVNGVDDAVPTTMPTWEAVNGPQGTVITTMSLTQLGGRSAERSRSTTATRPPRPDPQCWTDASLYGASGMFLNSGVPDTDPAYTNPPAVVRGVGPPASESPVADGSTIPALGDDFQKDVANPLIKTVTPYTG